MKNKLLFIFTLTFVIFSIPNIGLAGPIQCYPMGGGATLEGAVDCGNPDVGAGVWCNTTEWQYYTIRCDDIFITDASLIPHNSSGQDRCLNSCNPNPATKCVWQYCRTEDACKNPSYRMFTNPCVCNTKITTDYCVSWGSWVNEGVYTTLESCNAGCQDSQREDAQCFSFLSGAYTRYQCQKRDCQSFFCTGNATPDPSDCWAPSCTTVTKYTSPDGPDPVPDPKPSINSFEITNIPFRAFSNKSKEYYLLLRNQAFIYNLNLVWSTDYASSCSAGCSQGSCSSDWRGSVAVNGSKKVKNNSTPGEHIYTLTCTGPGGSTTASLRVFVKSFSWFEIIPRISMLPGREPLASLVNFL